MRLRRKPWIDTAIQDYADFVTPLGGDVRHFAGRWADEFRRTAPLHIEIGVGKGDFITELAARHPEVNYVGLEAQQGVLYFAARKAAERELKNLRLLVFDAAHLSELFAPGEVWRIYLNFSDPWPKKRHAKRRLTSEVFLARYREVLRPDGEIRFKTDNEGLFAYSLETMAQEGWRLSDVTHDLHALGDPSNIMTEYERKFSARGAKIGRLTARLPQEHD
ncbi:tRNA (guanosine(46)-N7)-methyltransferase TrmB [Selenomonas artemidis]|jgi:tRNA (guanine-N(7)-)-methyltransferase|uniref:tRNA (guanine-N(7)-)-methyltransferase n=1 Tax=Selenomonas artemidis F0399 TaxID=749551 RepID=E7N1S7_9FIRM|nr:tRNA (guanosine(46)-N7)-methyltransferase TrmB [Selenomonas artemidis]EFW29709.1 tRNA (guanine-N(7)-)-methyltransferase [Selenomonas artemidis F0399]